MNALPPIIVIHVLDRLEDRLLELLSGLRREQWDLPTVCAGWAVRDIASHLCDTSLRRVSAERDGHMPLTGPPPQSYAELVDLLNRLNADWVEATRRISPPALVDLVELGSRQMRAFLRTLDPFGKAIFPVAWAGEEASTTWFDIAREYTERWHHQQQIRDAVGQQGICTREFLHPVLDTFLRGLPHACRDIDRPDGTLLEVVVEGEAGGQWRLIRSRGVWKLGAQVPGTPSAVLRLDQDTAWRVLTKGKSREEALREAQLQGDGELAAAPVGWLAVMA